MLNTVIAGRRFVPVMLGAALLLTSASQVPAQTPTTLAAAPRTDEWWTNMHKDFLAQTKKGGIDLLFLGDSITQGWGGNETWKKHYTPRHAANFGIGGDGTQHVLWRVENGEIDGIKPRVIVMMIGTNNAGGSSADEIAAGNKAIVKQLRKRLPETKILLLGVFPRSEKPDDTRAKLKAVNEKIAKLDDGDKVHYLDIGSKFLREDGTISADIMPDFLHLSPKGYAIWADAIEPSLKKLLGEDK
ncbi:MAG: platelet-activating factor acetylhydrolase IB subunit [Paludisphaera borealis]|uniref:platelet-activating factor acetylhydrolase IB subunit n=1 Tax=Paludisphaera borealis TaxID=1387353 RepID=UPI00284D9687|nr:platelet-activating factor acetylhydrolase IB subunit [Paludisphaera borealis]MDR3621434.1 platelet-activating factor acetylhydrolase IB subunit [Paludisphaera borealis]